MIDELMRDEKHDVLVESTDVLYHKSLPCPSPPRPAPPRPAPPRPAPPLDCILLVGMVSA